MARSERWAWLLSLTLAGCLVKERPLAPEADASTASSPSSASASGTDAGDGHAARDAGRSSNDASSPIKLATDAASLDDQTILSETPSTQPQDRPRDGAAEPAASDGGSLSGDTAPSAVDATTPREPDATVGPVSPNATVWCRPDEPECREFDFELEVDADGYFGPFWCHPDGDCRAHARPVSEAPGSSNHVWVSAVAGNDAKALGAGINVQSWMRAVYKHAEIDFDIWPVSVVNDESAVWFSLQHIDPSNQGHAVLSLVSSLSGTFAVLGPVYSPDLTLRFAQPPAVGARAHVRIVLDRIDDERSSATITYGGETLRLSSLSMPLRETSGPAAYDITLGLFDGQQQRSVGAPSATARYDNFVNRTTFVP